MKLSKQQRFINQVLGDCGALVNNLVVSCFEDEFEDIEKLDEFIFSLEDSYLQKHRFGRFNDNVTRIAAYLLKGSKEILSDTQARRLVLLFRNNLDSTLVIPAVLGYYDGKIPDDPFFNFLIPCLQTLRDGDLKIELSSAQGKELARQLHRFESYEALQNISFMDASVARRFLDTVLEKKLPSPAYFRIVSNWDIPIPHSWFLRLIELYPESYQWVETKRSSLLRDMNLRDSLLIKYIGNLVSTPALDKWVKNLSNPKLMKIYLTHKNSKLRRYAKKYLEKQKKAETDGTDRIIDFIKSNSSLTWLSLLDWE